MKFCTIIYTHYSNNEKRSGVSRESIQSLLENTDYPFELTVVDNGENIEDSKFFLDLVAQGKINTYIRNATNIHFGMARNQGLRLSYGDYICIVDNDIIYRKGWLDSCIKVLDAFPEEKIYATPVYNVAHWLPKFWDTKYLEVDGNVYRLNIRAGSNCFVVRREDFEEIGEFLPHRVAGSKWTDEALAKGYKAAVTPQIFVEDVGFRDGYNYKDAIPIKIILSNGKEVYFNVDEFKRVNKHDRSLSYIQQRRFNGADRIRFIEES